MKKNSVILILVLLSIFVTILILGFDQQEADLKKEVDGADWQRGTNDAAVEMVIYGDYLCAGCRQFFNVTLPKLEEDFGNNLSIVYRNFVYIDEPNKFIPAYAAEAAGMQGKFWAMSKNLYEQEDLSEENTKKMARDLGLDMDKFIYDIKGESVQKSVLGDYRSAIESGADYSPYIFINGKAFQENAHSIKYKELKQAIREEL